MTVREAAAELHLSESATYKLIRAGLLPVHRLGPRGGKLFIDPADVAAYWASSKTVPAQARRIPALKHFQRPTA